MKKTNMVSTWGILRRIGGSFLAVCLVLPLLLLTDLSCFPASWSEWLWDFGTKLIGGKENED